MGPSGRHCGTLKCRSVFIFYSGLTGYHILLHSRHFTSFYHHFGTFQKRGYRRMVVRTDHPTDRRTNRVSYPHICRAGCKNASNKQVDKPLENGTKLSGRKMAVIHLSIIILHTEKSLVAHLYYKHVPFFYHWGSDKD